MNATIGAQVRMWLAEYWRPGMNEQEFLEDAVDAGWLVPTWSRNWFGLEMSDAEAEEVGREFERVRAPGRADLQNVHARVIYHLGSDLLREKYLRGLLVGQIHGCLLYSEPGAGSDLASLRTSAVREGSRWRISGQKVWTSGAQYADYGLLVARTDRTKPKHGGITFFVLSMRQPGVEVRPITQITGDTHFNEVFLTDAVVDDDHRLGEVNHGWFVLMTALGHERSVMGSRGSGSRMNDPRYVGTDDDLIGLAREHGLLHDSATVNALSDVYATRTALRLTTIRYAGEGRSADPATLSIGKLAMSRLLHDTARIRRDIVGSATLLDASAGDQPGAGSEAAGIANFHTLDAYFTSIGGGTDQIQRNIIGERILGLPKEPDPSKSVPFNEIRQG